MFDFETGGTAWIECGGLVLSSACWAAVVAGFLRGDWVGTAESMIDDRAAMEEAGED